MRIGKFCVQAAGACPCTGIAIALSASQSPENKKNERQNKQRQNKQELFFHGLFFCDFKIFSSNISFSRRLSRYLRGIPDLRWVMISSLFFFGWLYTDSRSI